MKYIDQCGYVILAFNTDDVDYVECACTLAKSLRFFHPSVKICLITDQQINNNLFDYIKTVPNLGGYNNDIYAFTQSPFHETIKLEADMLVTSPFDHWWSYFRHYNVWLSTGCRDFKGNIATRRHYRQIIDANYLPDVYNAVTYWRVSREAKRFFDTVKNLFNNWSSVQNSLLYAREEPLNTDLAYAVAAEMLGREQFTSLDGPTITHMKPKINQLSAEDWSKQLVWEILKGQVRLNGSSQHGLLHYHVKSLAKDFGKRYEQKLF